MTSRSHAQACGNADLSVNFENGHIDAGGLIAYHADTGCLTTTALVYPSSLFPALNSRVLMIRLNVLLASCLFTVLFQSSLFSQETALFPPEVQLTSPESQQQLLLQRRADDLTREQITEGIEWSSEDTTVATVDKSGLVHPVGDGRTEIVAEVDGVRRSVPVTVTAQAEEFQWNFRAHVLPVLSKAGCNMGACHGALAGKGGFRLSLRGYDPVSDHFNIVKQDRGRRVEFADPGRSLFVSKPSGAIPHKGGLRLPIESRNYRIVAEWIAHGAPAPTEADPVVTSLAIYPPQTQLSLGQQQQIIVSANSSNGHVDDVTPWVKWTSTNEAVCTVDEAGQVTVVGPGEGAILAWYSSKIALARITVPYDNTVPASTFATLQPRGFIDELINKQLQRLNLPPSPACDDAAFIRRVFLDTIGVLPTPQETRQFLADKAVDKRDKLIDQLLQRPEFVDYWTYKWSDVLMLNGTLLRPEALKAYYQWIHSHVEKNTPWDQFVQEIVTATGDTFVDGATNFYALYETPEDMTENACQAFLGLSIGCAKCHNHPLEKWTNDQYYAMANIFSRVRSKGWGGERRNGDGRRTTFVVDTGELVQPRTGKPQPPTPLDGDPIPFDDPTDRRAYLADWLTSPENPYFAKSITNRIWANYFGVGLVESIDDMRVSNPASNEELLNRTAQFVVENKFDLKALMREIMRSQAYQRSSLPVDGNEADKRFYSRYFPRRLNAEVLHDAIAQVTTIPTTFDSVGFPGADFQKTEFYPEGTRAVQLYDSAVVSYFLKTFGRNTRNIVCECERSNEPSMVQVLHLSNGSTINDKLASEKSFVTELLTELESGGSVDGVIDEAYLRSLTRYPRPDERQRFANILNDAPATDRRIVLEDLFWALLTSREFIFNH